MISASSNIFYFRLDPEYPTAYYRKGDIFLLMGRDYDAIALINRAISMRPNYPLYLCTRA